MPTLEFKGKQHIYAHHLTVPYRPLVPDAGRSLNPADVDDNLIIHGDNLHALKALLPRYAGKVKCIYIDPPYNTGNEGWVYNDRVNSPLLNEWFKHQSPVDGEDLERHDKWLCMMWPRLHLLRELLADDGVIFVTIDDNEQHYLRMLMDEVFGESNFTANIIWQHRKSSQNDIDVSLSHNYILCYALDRSSFSFNAGNVDESKFSNPDNDPRGPWVADPMDAPAVRGCLKSWGACQAAEHESGHSGVDPGFGGFRQCFIILAQSPVPAQPGESALHHPASGQHLKAVAVPGTPHYLQSPTRQCRHPLDQLSGVAAICPDQAQPGKPSGQLADDQLGPIPVLHVGWVHRHRQQQSLGIHHNMPFAAFHLLARVVPPRPPFSVVFTDWLSMMAPLGLGWRPRNRRIVGSRAS